MKLLDKPTLVDKPLPIPFTPDKDGWYLILVSARVKPKNQLRIEIDGKTFSDAAAFFGSKQKNTLKTVYFFIHLSAGNHTLSLIPDKEATVETVEVNSIDQLPSVHLELNTQAERANGRPWMTFVLVDTPLQSFTVKATVAWRFPDGDDLKIIVNGKVKKNNLSLLHRNWIFASNVLRKIIGGETTEKIFEENLSKDSHYIEFWSDESPTLHFLRFEIEIAETPSTIQVYKKGPQGEDYNRLDADIVASVKTWNDEFLGQKFPPPEPLDPNLVKAIVYVESQMGYGSSPTGNPAYPDVMQVGNPDDPALHVLNNDKDPRFPAEFEVASGKPLIVDYKGEAKVEKPYDSIYWGVRWLYHKAQGIDTEGKQVWYHLKEAVSRYGPGTKVYQESVWNLYQYGKEPNGGENLF